MNEIPCPCGCGTMVEECPANPGHMHSIYSGGNTSGDCVNCGKAIA